MPDYSICWESAVGLAKRIRGGELTSAEATESLLAAIQEFNGPINAVVTLDENGAVEAAKTADAKIQSGELSDSPLAGVPFLAKDLDVTAGVRTTFGSRIQEDYVPTWDATHIARLKAAGCVLLGKANTPEDGMIPNTYNDVFGVTRNPWNLDLAPGGSSGGSAAAAAAGFAPLTTGSDGGGSIRCPSSFCGVFGLKPTFGSIPFGPKGIGVCNSVGHLGPITRTVADAAAMLDVMTGEEERDRMSLAKGPDLLSGLEAPFAPKRVAYSFDLGYATVEPEVRALFEHALAKLQDAGWPLEEAHPDAAGSTDAIDTTILFEWGTSPMLMADANPETFALHTDEAKALVNRCRALTVADIWTAAQKRKDLCVEVGRFFDTYDLLITPTLTRTAYEAGQAWPSDPDHPGEFARSFTELMVPFNLTGDPACSIPMGRTPDGMPAGLQMVAPRHADLRVLQAAQAFESMTGCSNERPPHGVIV